MGGVRDHPLLPGHPLQDAKRQEEAALFAPPFLTQFEQDYSAEDRYLSSNVMYLRTLAKQTAAAAALYDEPAEPLKSELKSGGISLKKAEKPDEPDVKVELLATNPPASPCSTSLESAAIVEAIATRMAPFNPRAMSEFQVPTRASHLWPSASDCSLWWGLCRWQRLSSCLRSLISMVMD